MAETTALQILQGHSLGPFALGASIHDVLARIKSLPIVYPSISLSYSQSHPLNTPVVINLPHNGLRLRFDGPEQRLRLIEVLDFGKTHLAYKGHDIGKQSDEEGGANHFPAPSAGPTFRQVYKIFGPTTPGEYLRPKNEGDTNGTYVLSYPGIAFSFPLQSSTWNASTTWSSTVSLLSSTATGPSTSLSIFSGESWETARSTLFSADLSTFLRSPVPLGLRKEHVPRELESARVYDRGRIELVRKDAPSFWIVLGETTPQDLVTELGAPDSIHRKNDRRVSIHRARKNSSVGHSRRGSSNSDMSPPTGGRHGLPIPDSEQSSQAGGSDSDDEDSDVLVEGVEKDHGSEQVFYNYYSHGFDILVSYPTPPSAASPTAQRPQNFNTRDGSPGIPPTPSSTDPVLPRSHLTVTKVLFHGNVPGSWAFNRHRRLRWTLESVPLENGYKDLLTSEMHWRDIRGQLQEVFRDHYATKEEERAASLPMVLNRGWGREELGMEGDWGVVGGWEDGAGGKAGAGGKHGEEGEQEKMGAAEVYGFPGLVFEVLKNGAVSCLMVY